MSNLDTATETVEVVFGRHVIPVPYNRAYMSGAVLYGYSIYETSGSASAQFNIYDGGGTNGLLVLPIPLSAGQGAEDWFGPQGIIMRSGIFTSVASGAVNGSLFVHFPHHRL